MNGPCPEHVGMLQPCPICLTAEAEARDVEHGRKPPVTAGVDVVLRNAAYGGYEVFQK